MEKKKLYNISPMGKDLLQYEEFREMPFVKANVLKYIVRTVNRPEGKTKSLSDLNKAWYYLSLCDTFKISPAFEFEFLNFLNSRAGLLTDEICVDNLEFVIRRLTVRNKQSKQ